jgi:hypothetical protein
MRKEEIITPPRIFSVISHSNMRVKEEETRRNYALYYVQKIKLTV